MRKIAAIIGIFTFIMVFGLSKGVHAVTTVNVTSGVGTPSLLEEDIRNKLGQDQKQLALGFANANAFSSRAGTFQGYQGYDLFAVSAGATLGLQLPTSSMGEIGNVISDMEENLDILAGIGAGSAINVGVHMSIFKFLLPFDILDDFYVSFKLMYLPINVSSINLKMKFITWGLTVNYQIFNTRKFLAGLFMWRGLSAGVGILYNKNTIDIGVNVLKIPDVGGLHLMDPELTLNLKNETVTIPFDVTTSVRLLWFLNINLGFGIDFNAGETDLSASSISNVAEDSAPTVQVGTANIATSTKGVKPSPVTPRITTGIGFNLGPVKLDFPLTWYLVPKSAGFSLGMSVLFVW